MAYSHFYPWQILTRLLGVQITHRIDRQFDAAKLQGECAAILEAFSLSEQHGPYHDGGWKAIGLRSLGGDPHHDHDSGDDFKMTPVLDLAPYMGSILSGFTSELRRVRLMQLLPGESIYWHFDKRDSINADRVRLHIPIITSPDVEFQMSHEDCRWLPGELWYGDFAFPHRLHNGGTSARVHLVIDTVVDDSLRRLVGPRVQTRPGMRQILQKICMRLCRIHMNHTKRPRKFGRLQPAEPREG